MITAVLLGLLIGLTLGALGGGGSILAVPVLAHLAGLSAADATATSLIAVGASAAVGAIGHQRHGRVRWGPALAFIVAGIPGAWAGSRVNELLDGDVLLLVFSLLILVAAHRMLTACPSCTNVGEERAMAATDEPPGELAPAEPGTSGPSATEAEAASSSPVAVASRTDPERTPSPGRTRRVGPGGSSLGVLAAGIGVGFMTGLFGVGGGFVIVPAMTLALGLSMPYAIGTSLAVVMGNALVALGFRGLDAVDWTIAGPFTFTMLVGTLAGSLLAHRLPAARSLQGFAALLVVVAFANGLAAAIALAR